ncbi:CarD family transcriptional regulator [Streptomyces sp. NPDC051985]|uniref:CarD family transcriptional regulator n=1 Tax=Streptomyces sp. NPDC051985 TaxID=3155807 RepID=UPI0034144AA4
MIEVKVGSRFIHPRHGVVEISGTDERLLNGNIVDYVVMDASSANLTIKIPVESFETVGVRPAMEMADIELLFKVLRSGPSEELRNWSRRFKDNEQRILSGDAYLIAEVVRNLSKRGGADGYVSHGERKLLDRARRAVEAEIQLALGIGPEEAAERLDEELELTGGRGRK